MSHPALRAAIYPVVLLGLVGAATACLFAGWHPTIVVIAANVAGALVIGVLERLRPYREQWLRSHDDVGTDLLHVFFAMMPVPLLFRAVLLGTLMTAATWLSRTAGQSLWPSQSPLVLQLVLALIVAELGQYWVHRLAHERSALWRFHAVHHSVERLYWLNASRFHPVDTLLQHAGEMAPLVLLGASPEVLALFTVFTSVNGLLRHGNIDMNARGLNWILSTADLHRWHHSAETSQSNANYGANLILWDVIFRTRQPPAETGPARLGLTFKDFPRRFVPLMLAPFRWRW